MEDELAAEYFGGILACSRTPDRGEDISYNYMQTLKALTEAQIRFHYILYSAAKLAIAKKAHGKRKNDVLEGVIFIPFFDLLPPLRLAEGTNIDHFFRLAVRMMASNSLIGEIMVEWGPPDWLNDRINGMIIRKKVERRLFGEQGGFCFSITGYGIDLFMHAHGLLGYTTDPPWDVVTPFDHFELQFSELVSLVRDLPTISSVAE